MDESIQYIILILVLLVLELIHIVWAKSKIKKWILPILSFLLSVYIMIYLIGFVFADQIGTNRKSLMEVLDIGTLMMFPMLNIPTLMFIITNVIVNKKGGSIKNKKIWIDKKQKH